MIRLKLITTCSLFVGENLWSLTLNVPKNQKIEYRYFIASIDPTDESNIVHVRKWETHLNPRQICTNDRESNDTDTQGDIDHFGIVDGVEKIDKGWLMDEHIFQFKFFNNPFALKERVKNRLLHVKV